MNKLFPKRIYKTLAALLLTALLLPGTAAFAADAAADGGKNLDYLKSVMDMIVEQYKGELTESQLIQGAVAGMLNSLDKYTTFLTPEEAESFMGGRITGIGVTLQQNGEYITVIEVFQGSPAQIAGIRQGDKIVEVDGKSLIGKSTDDAVSLIKGKYGTRVRLCISRDGGRELRYYDMQRKTVKVSPVSYEVRDGIGYIKLDSFNENTEEYINAALEELDNKNVTRLVLDLRDNPGGEVDQAVAVARKFVPRGRITTLDYKSEASTDIVYESNLDAPRYKLAVLVNGNSASASEIFAGAVQDTSAGKLIGTKTFGKAKFQGMIPMLTTGAYEKYEKQLGAKLVDAYELMHKYGVTPLESEITGYAKITLGLYYTPNGRMIDGTGLAPDYAVDDPKPVNDVGIIGIRKLTQTFKAGLNDMGMDVYNAERILKLLGFDIDVPDTLLDKKTFEAIKEFQESSGLWAYGILDLATQKELNGRLDALTLQLDTQYTKAVEILNKQ